MSGSRGWCSEITNLGKANLNNTNSPSPQTASLPLYIELGTVTCRCAEGREQGKQQLQLGSRDGVVANSYKYKVYI